MKQLFLLPLFLLIISQALNASFVIEPADWIKFNHVGGVEVNDNVFSARITGIDPWLTTTNVSGLNADELKLIKFELKMAKEITDKGQIFWKTQLDNKYAGSRHVNFKINADGKWHEYVIPVYKSKGWNGEITGIRFDPAIEPEKLEFFELRNFEVIAGKKGSRQPSIVALSLETQNSKPLPSPSSYPDELFNPAGALLLDGKPTFVLHTGDLPVVENPFGELSAAGFNLITFAGVSKGLLDELAKYNLKVLLYIRYESDQAESSFGQKVTAFYERYPRLKEMVGAFFATDEPAWHGFPIEAMAAAYNFYKDFKPRRPVWINHAPRNSIDILKKYNAAGDVTGADIYPVPDGNHSDLPNKTISSVGDYTDKMVESALPGQPVWMYLQAYARAGEIPTFHQTRFMAYNTIVHGAMGICYYGMRHLSWPNEMWPQLKRLGPELRGLNDVLVAPWSSRLIQQDGMEVRHKQVGDELYVFCLNKNAHPVEFNFSFDQDIQELFVLLENRKVVPGQNGFTDKFEPYDVHVYSTRMIERFKKFSEKSTNWEWVWQSDAHWIWDKSAQRQKDAVVYFRRLFDVKEMPAKANIMITVDNHYRLYCNGKFVGEDVNSSNGGWEIAQKYDLRPFLREKSQNVIAVEGINDTGKAGFLAEIHLDEKKIVTDEFWRTSTQKEEDWKLFCSDENWHTATSYGKPPCPPWNYFGIFPAGK